MQNQAHVESDMNQKLFKGGKGSERATGNGMSARNNLKRSGMLKSGHNGMGGVGKMDMK